MEPEWLPRWASLLDGGPTRRGRFSDPSRGKAARIWRARRVGRHRGNGPPRGCLFGAEWLHQSTGPLGGNSGISPFTLGIEIAALVAAADHLPAEDRPYALSLADYWNERLEDWTYVESGAFLEEFGVEGYYVRVAPAMSEGGLCGRVDVRNRGGERVPAVTLIGMEYLYLPRLGLRDPRDPRIQNTLKITKASLRSRPRMASHITATTGTATASMRTGVPSTALVLAAPGHCSQASAVISMFSWASIPCLIWR